MRFISKKGAKYIDYVNGLRRKADPTFKAWRINSRGKRVRIYQGLPGRPGTVYKSETNSHPIYRDEGTI